MNKLLKIIPIFLILQLNYDCDYLKYYNPKETKTYKDSHNNHAKLYFPIDVNYEIPSIIEYGEKFNIKIILNATENIMDFKFSLKIPDDIIVIKGNKDDLKNQFTEGNSLTYELELLNKSKSNFEIPIYLNGSIKETYIGTSRVMEFSVKDSKKFNFEYNSIEFTKDRNYYSIPAKTEIK